MNHLKRVLKVIVIGICFGIVLLIIQNALQIDEDVFLRVYWKAAPVIVIGVVLGNVIYNISYQRKMQHIVTLLDTGKTKEYIVEVEKLLQTAKGQNLRNILKVNLAAGYFEMKQFDKSINLLEELNDKHISGSAGKMVQRLNLCMSYFYAEQYEKAMELYKESQKIFEPYRNHKIYGGNIAALDILVKIRNEQYKQAEKLLDTAKKSWNAPRLQNALLELGNVLMERKTESKK